MALDFEKYKYAGLAANLARSEESAVYVPGALEVLAGRKGLDLGEESLGFVKGTQASEEGIKTAIGAYAKKFEDKRGKYKPLELIDWYNSVLTGLGEEEKNKYIGTLKEHDETLNSINKKYKRASHIVNYEDPKELFTDEQISEAKKTLKKYKNLLTVIAILDNYKFEELRPDAVKVTRKNSLEALAKEL